MKGTPIKNENNNIGQLQLQLARDTTANDDNDNRA